MVGFMFELQLKGTNRNVRRCVRGLDNLSSIVLAPLTKRGFVSRIGVGLTCPVPIECKWG